MKTKTTAVLAVFCLGLASTAAAADLVFSPANVTLQVPVGASAATQVVVSVRNPPPPPGALTFALQVVGGSMPAGWLTARTFTMAGGAGSMLLPLTIAVPATAAPGHYVATVQPAAAVAAYPLAPSASPLELNVEVKGACSAPPAVSVSSLERSELKPPNGWREDVRLSGAIVLPSGCGLQGAWFELVDEYGAEDSSAGLAVAPDGSFSFTVAVTVARRGDDKNGREYRITVRARDEAGTGSSPAQTVTVAHDQRRGK